jgi:hypothetical protein
LAVGAIGRRTGAWRRRRGRIETAAYAFYLRQQLWRQRSHLLQILLLPLVLDVTVRVFTFMVLVRIVSLILQQILILLAAAILQGVSLLQRG